jgi:predicted aspartyl protease
MAAENSMGRVTCEVRVENAIDSARARAGEIPAESIRSIRITDALIDTGATTLALPKSMILQLGFDTPR